MNILAGNNIARSLGKIKTQPFDYKPTNMPMKLQVPLKTMSKFMQNQNCSGTLLKLKCVEEPELKVKILKLVASKKNENIPFQADYYKGRIIGLTLGGYQKGEYYFGFSPEKQGVLKKLNEKMNKQFPVSLGLSSELYSLPILHGCTTSSFSITLLDGMKYFLDQEGIRFNSSSFERFLIIDMAKNIRHD